MKASCGDGEYSEDWDLDELMVMQPQDRASVVDRACATRGCSTTSRPAEAVFELFHGDALAQLRSRRKRRNRRRSTLREIERRVMLSVIDQHWREHLYEMDYLREGINLRAMGQKRSARGVAA